MMARASRRASSPIVRRIAWGALWLVLALVSIEFLLNVQHKYGRLDSAAYAMFMTRRSWLWCHLAGGSSTLVLGLFQFVTQRWRKHLHVHRWLGRAYFACMLIGSIGAAGLIATSPAPFAIRAAFAATMLAWLSTGLCGLIAILRGQLQRHRRWMIRNYLVTLAPVIFRALLPTAIATGLMPTPIMIATLLWTSWVLPLALHELIHRMHGPVHPARPGRLATNAIAQTTHRH